MAQPSQTPDWNTGGANRVDPPSGQKTSGWTVNQFPPSSYFNWWMNLVYQWVLYLKNLTTEALTWGPFQTFNSGLRGYGNNVNPGVRGDSGGSGFAGVHGNSAFGASTEAGVRGTTNNNSGTGVKGEATGTNGIAVHGDATVGGAGVKGSSVSGIGVFATSTNGFGALLQSTNNIGAIIASSTNIGLQVSSSPGPGGDTIPSLQSIGAACSSVDPGRPAISASGGGVDDPGDAQTQNAAAAIIARGGNSYGDSTIAPAIPNIDAAPGIITYGGDVDGAANDGRPGPGIVAQGGTLPDLGVNSIIGGVGVKAIGGLGSAGKGNAIEADGVIEVNDKIKLTGSNLASNVGQSNEITPGLVVKAWARVRISSGTYTLQAGQNITSVVAGTSPTTGQFKLNLASPVARTTRVVIIHSDLPTHIAHAYDDTASLGAGNSVVTFEVLDRVAGTTVNLTTNTVRMHIIVLGLQ